MAPRTIRGLAGYFLALLVVVGCWAVGVPRFGSPDETAHVYKAYGTAHGELLGKVAPGFPDNLREFDGPDSLGPPNLNCYVGQPDVPASCATEISPQLISSAARYPPWYYGLVGVPVAVTGQSDQVTGVSAGLCGALRRPAGAGRCCWASGRARRPGRVAARGAHTDGAVPDGIRQSERDRDRRLRGDLGLPDQGDDR